PCVQCREKQRKQGKRSRGDILIGDVKRSPGNRQRQQSRNQAHTCPARFHFIETLSTPFPTRQESQKDGCDVPEKNRGIKREMRDSYGRSNEICKLCRACMVEKKLGTERIKTRIEDFLDAGKIDLTIFGGRVVSVYHQASHRQC